MLAATKVYQVDPAAIAAAAAKAAAASSSVFAIPAGKSWYQVWWGAGAIGLLGLGVVIGGYKLIA